MSTRLYDALREIPDYRDPRGVIYKLAGPPFHDDMRHPLRNEERRGDRRVYLL